MTGKKALVIVAIIFILSLIPLYIIGFYAHPSVDDYYYGVETAGVWKASHSISQVVNESFSQMKNTYNVWQGNFSAIFLMRLQPAIFGEQYYAVAPIILISSFVICMFTFIYTMVRKWFFGGRLSACGIGIAVTFAAMQFTYVPSDSFYWYNGAIYYTFFFSLALLLFTLVTYIIKSDNMIYRAIFTVLSVILSFLIGGGNYCTALVTGILLIILCAYLFRKKDGAAWPVLAIALVSLVSLFISIKAPGNAIRQESVGGSTGVVKALIYSFAYGAYNISDSTSFANAAMWIGLCPILYRLAKNFGQKHNFKFRLPLLVLVGTYCIYSAQGTPLFYAQGLRMPYRMMNIIYFSYYIFMLINLFYLMGWLATNYGEKAFFVHVENIASFPKRLGILFFTTIVLFVVGCVGNITVTENEDGGAAFSGLPMSLSAAYSLMNGDARAYDNELNRRIEYLEGTPQQDVTLEPLTRIPEVIFHTDITDDPTHWKNAHLALYYNKNSIWLSN